MNIRILISAILLWINIKLTQAIKITGLALAYPDEVSYYNIMVKEFNNYAVKTDLDISLDLTIITPNNFTVELNNFSSLMDYLLNRKSRKYDLYFYYGLYNKKYGKHFLNLDGKLPEGHLDPYDQGIINSTCIYDNHLIGLPVTIDIDVLYSNTKYLKKYNMKIPKTWDELIEISKYIIDEEKKNNNYELKAFNGLLDESEEGILFIYQMIHSYRKTIDSVHPELRSEETTNALKKMKQLLEELSSVSRFLSEDLIFDNFDSGNSLFIKYWYSNYTTLYDATYVPGWRDGITGTVISTYNIAINKYSDKKKQDAAFEALKFATSKDFQKKMLIEEGIYSAMKVLYEDDDVCKVTDCQLFRDGQPLVVFDIENEKDIKLFNLNVDEYLRKYQSYIYDYLYNDESLSKALKNIEDMTKYYKISVNPKETKTGLFIAIIFTIITIIMGLSLIYLAIKKYYMYFLYLPVDFWIISVFGCFIAMCSVLTLYGEVTSLKCHLRRVLLSFGFTINITPILYELIVCLYDDNQIFNMIRIHKYIFIFIFFIIESILCILLGLSPYDKKNIFVDKGENFQKCKMNKSFGKVIQSLLLAFEIVLILLTLLFIFLQWNIKRTKRQVRYIFSAIFIDIMAFILFYVFENVLIKDYTAYSIVLAIDLFILPVTNFLFIYANQILLIYFGNDESYISYNNSSKGSKENRFGSSDTGTDYSNKGSLVNNYSSSNINLPTKLMKYHNRVSIG